MKQITFSAAAGSVRWAPLAIQEIRSRTACTRSRPRAKRLSRAMATDIPTVTTAPNWGAHRSKIGRPRRDFSLDICSRLWVLSPLSPLKITVLVYTFSIYDWSNSTAHASRHVNILRPIHSVPPPCFEVCPHRTPLGVGLFLPSNQTRKIGDLLTIYWDDLRRSPLPHSLRDNGGYLGMDLLKPYADGRGE